MQALKNIILNILIIIIIIVITIAFNTNIILLTGLFLFVKRNHYATSQKNSFNAVFNVSEELIFNNKRTNW